MNVRKNIIIDQKLWNFLAAKAEADSTSVSQLIENAVNHSYKPEDIYARRREAVNKVLEMRDKYRQKGKLDYRAMAHEDHNR